MGLPDLTFADHTADEYDVAVADVQVAASFHRMLKALDERLVCFWAKKGSGFDPDERWYIGRIHPNPELAQYWVITDEFGGYCLPQERHIERLQQMDTWTGRRRYSDFELARSAKARKQQKAFEDKRAEFREKLEERLRHLHEVQISVPRNLSATGQPAAKVKAVERASGLLVPSGAHITLGEE